MAMKSTVKTITEEILEIYCDYCGQLTATEISCEDYKDVNEGRIRVQLNLNNNYEYYESKDICKDCAIKLSNKIKSILTNEFRMKIKYFGGA